MIGSNDEVFLGLFESWDMPKEHYAIPRSDNHGVWLLLDGESEVRSGHNCFSIPQEGLNMFRIAKNVLISA